MRVRLERLLVSLTMRGQLTLTGSLMRMDMQTGTPSPRDARPSRPAPAPAMLMVASEPAWYIKLLAIAILAVFVFMLARVLVILALGAWRALTQRTASPAPLTLRWSAPKDRFQPDSLLWALANVMVFSVRNGDAWDRLVLDEAKDVARDGLRASWHIHDRQSLMMQLRWLSEEGHRGELQRLARRFATMPQEQFDQERAKAEQLRDGEDKSDLLWRMQVAREDRDGIRYVDFLAWDLVRFIWLCRHGVHLGYLDEAEAPAMLLPVSQRLQQAYEGWEDCADQFLRARGFWTGGNPAYNESQAAIRETIRLLREDAYSPWKRMDWHMPLYAVPAERA